MNLSAILADVYRRINLPTAPTSASSTRITAFVNEVQQEILSEPGMESLLNDHTTFASDAGSTWEYALPPIVSRIKTIRDYLNLRTLGEMSEQEYRALVPSPSVVTGRPTHWVDLGYSPVQWQPVNENSKLYAVSDSASDGATKSVTIEGFRKGATGSAGTYFASQTTALNGVTAVQIGSASDWFHVTKFEIVLTAGGTTTAVGNIILTETSAAGLELARIPPGAAYSRYRWIALYPTPTAVVTYRVDFERELTDMTNATDEPIVPPRFHHLLAIGARVKEYEKTDSPRYQQARAEYVKGLKLMKYWIAQQAAGQPNLRPFGSQYERPSRLGGWYPSV